MLSYGAKKNKIVFDNCSCETNQLTFYKVCRNTVLLKHFINKVYWAKWILTLYLVELLSNIHFLERNLSFLCLCARSLLFPYPSYHICLA